MMQHKKYYTHMGCMNTIESDRLGRIVCQEPMYCIRGKDTDIVLFAAVFCHPNKIEWMLAVTAAC